MKTKILPLTAMFLVFSFLLQIQAQVIRNFNQVYSDNIKGGHVMFGNTAMAIYSSGSGSTGTVNTTLMNRFGSYSNSRTSDVTNDQNNMQFLDIDGDASTTRSSAADLILPTGTNTIRFARLYWGARINNSDITANDANIRTIKIKGPGGTYATYTAPAGQLDKYAISTTSKVYQTYIDITSLVNASKAGTYTVADIAGTAGNMNGGGGYFGGWTIVVVYENPSLDWTSIRVYDGYLQVFDEGSVTTQSITLTGLNAPDGTLTPEDAYLSVMSWEGDAALAVTTGNPLGDYLKINGNIYSNAVNPAANMWNGTISKNGSHVTTKNPSYLNQFGIDIDEIQVGGSFGITGGITSATVEFGTEADQYFPSIFAFSIRMQPPQIQVNKTVSDANGNTFVERDEILTFELNGWDEVTATGYAYNVHVVDTLSPAIEYIPNSMYRWHDTTGTWLPVTDAIGDDCSHVGTFNGKTYLFFNVGSGACASTGGTLIQGQSFKVKFQVKALFPVQVNNIARMFAESEAGEDFTDDAFAVIGANQAPLAVRLISFNGNYNGNLVQLQWLVASESNTAFYEVQRSTNGVDFENAGIITVNGSSDEQKSYKFSDEISNGPSVLYYRLKETGLNNKSYVSNVIKLNNGTNQFTVKMNGPNPFSSYIQFNIVLPEQAKVDVRILDVRGVVVAMKYFNGLKGNNLFKVEQVDDLPEGIYILEVNTPLGRKSLRIMK